MATQEVTPQHVTWNGSPLPDDTEALKGIIDRLTQAIEAERELTHEAEMRYWDALGDAARAGLRARQGFFSRLMARLTGGAE